MKGGHNKILTLSFFFFFNRSNLLNWAYTVAQKIKLNLNKLIMNKSNPIAPILGNIRFIAVVGYLPYAVFLSQMKQSFSHEAGCVNDWINGYKDKCKSNVSRVPIPNIKR